MNVKYINPFIEASQLVAKMLCGVEVTPSKIHLKNSPFLFNDVVIIIGITGRIKGQAFFELSADTAKKIASSMMGGMLVEELNEISKSAVCEMGNMIMGNASTIFESKDIQVDITSPVLMVGEKIEISNKVPSIVVPLELEGLGTISINVAAEETIQ